MGKGKNKYSGVKELEEEEYYSNKYNYNSASYDYSESTDEYNQDCFPEVSTPNDDYFKEKTNHSNLDLINLLNSLTQTNNKLLKEDEENQLKFLYFHEEIEKMLKEKSMNVLRLRTLATLSDLKDVYDKNINFITKLSFDKDIIKSYQEENYKILEETKELYDTLVSYHEKTKPESLKSYISAFKSLFN